MIYRTGTFDVAEIVILTYLCETEVKTTLTVIIRKRKIFFFFFFFNYRMFILSLKVVISI